MQVPQHFQRALNALTFFRLLLILVLPTYPFVCVQAELTQHALQLNASQAGARVRGMLVSGSSAAASASSSSLQHAEGQLQALQHSEEAVRQALQATQNVVQQRLLANEARE